MRIAAAGDNCIDYYEDRNRAYAGGNSVNVAVYLKRLGISSSYIGAVGNDNYGKFLLNQLKAKSVDVSSLRIKDGKTALTKVTLIEGERVFGAYDEGVMSDFKLDKQQKDFICTHDLVVTGLWGHLYKDLQYFKEKGTGTAFDAATRPFHDNSLIAMKSCDYFFFSADAYSDNNLLKKDMEKIYRAGSKQVIATCGEKGSLAYDGKSFRDFGIIKCKVTDTMGAGDSYIAGYLKAALEGRDIRTCMEAGAKNAVITISYTGAW